MTAGAFFDRILLQDAYAISPPVHTPAPASLERREILDAMRQKIRELHELDVVFVVKTMNVGSGWAWVHTLPQSGDGKGRYEDFYALLHKKLGRWTIVEIPCTEPDNPDCLDSPGYFRKLARKYPGIPRAIMPGVRKGL
ncbi:MAG: hypothetical protein HGB20_02315 [Chlorobiaceae bacterium]|nr:hypothetical protein [Chlorobiaceae bacterium]